MKRKCFLLLFLLGIMGCSAFDDQTLDNPCQPLTLTTKQCEYNAAGHAFDFNLIKRTDKHLQGDWLISPLSMQCLLGILLNGAQGETARQICETLGYGSQERNLVNAYFQSMLRQLPALDKASKLNLANAMFARYDIPIKESFKGTAQNYYQATIANINQAEDWAKTINGWCTINTNGLITHIVDHESNADVIVLNALYFKSSWSNSFPKSQTEEEIFTAESGTTRKLAMMKNSGDGKGLLYGEHESFQLLRLPYGNGAFAMYVLLPKDKKSIHSIIDELDYSAWVQVCSSMYCPGMIDIWLPRFKRSGDKEVVFNDILSEMGMPLIFGNGDFTLISEELKSFSRIQQNTAIVVTEEGTEAAAVTQAVGLGLSGSVFFHADHPFLYLICEASTGSVLFAGCFTGEE